MKRKILKAFSILIIISTLFPISASGSPPRPPEITEMENEMTVTASSAQTDIDLATSQRRLDGRISLIIELDAPPLGLAPLMRNQDFEVESTASAAYLTGLAQQQDVAIKQLRSLAPSAVVGQRYRAAFNGFSVWVAPEEAAALLELDSVKHVYPDRMRTILLDLSIEVINAPDFWSDLGGQSRAGDGVRIAVIDTGIRCGKPALRRHKFRRTAQFSARLLR